MGLSELSPRCDAYIIRHDYLAYLDAAIENFHESVGNGRDRNAAMQTFFADISEQIVIVVGELERQAGHHEARAFLMEQYIPQVAAFFQTHAQS